MSGRGLELAGLLVAVQGPGSKAVGFCWLACCLLAGLLPAGWRWFAAFGGGPSLRVGLWSVWGACGGVLPSLGVFVCAVARPLGWLVCWPRFRRGSGGCSSAGWAPSPSLFCFGRVSLVSPRLLRLSADLFRVSRSLARPLAGRHAFLDLSVRFLYRTTQT